MLVASMNPSPGGYFSDTNAVVSSSTNEMLRYMSKISGPLLDRIDLHIEVSPVPFENLSDKRPAESSAAIRERVRMARERQHKRYESVIDVHYNAQMSTRLVREFVQSMSRACIC